MPIYTYLYTSHANTCSHIYGASTAASHVGNKVVFVVYSKHILVLQSWMTIQKTEILAQHEFLNADISRRT